MCVAFDDDSLNKCNIYVSSNIVVKSHMVITSFLTRV